MTTLYEVWDRVTANLLASFDSDQDARDFIADILEVNPELAETDFAIDAVPGQ